MTTYAVVVTATNICDNIVVWDDTLGPWNPPANHYIVNINDLSVGIGFYYDSATQVWTAPPSIIASFNPSPIFLSQTTVLTWTTQSATSVKVAGADAAINGSQSFTPNRVGEFSVSVSATGLAGTTSTTAIVTVVATQSELSA